MIVTEKQRLPVCLPMVARNNIAINRLHSFIRRINSAERKKTSKNNVKVVKNLKEVNISDRESRSRWFERGVKEAFISG